jgi:TnpA family transposase
MSRCSPGSSRAGVWEAVYILDGLLRNDSDIQPDTVHADTQGQSLPVYGLAALLGFDLLPRIRNWHDLIFFRPGPQARYRHIDSLFGPQAIDWRLLEAHWPDLMRTAISVREGRISSVTLLSRLRHDSRKNRLYQALRELGRVVCTQVLLRFLSEPPLRETITVITNRVESFHRFATWFGFGAEEGVLATNDPSTRKNSLNSTSWSLTAACIPPRWTSPPSSTSSSPTAGGSTPTTWPPQPADHPHDPPLRRLAPRPHPTRGHR